MKASSHGSHLTDGETERLKEVDGDGSSPASQAHAKSCAKSPTQMDIDVSCGTL